MLNDTEKKILGLLLDDYADKLGNAGCNDFDLPDTDEGRALATEVKTFEGEDDYPGVCVMDFALLACLRKKLGL